MVNEAKSTTKPDLISTYKPPTPPPTQPINQIEKIENKKLDENKQEERRNYKNKDFEDKINSLVSSGLKQ